MKKAIIIGATSGIGWEVAKKLSQKGYLVGITGRRTELLNKLQKELPAKSYLKTLDLCRQEEAIGLLEQLIAEMGGIDLLVINSGIGFSDPDLDWPQEKKIIEVNVAGFVAMAGVAFKHFVRQRSGHIVGISSVAALRGHGRSPVYNASKAFVSNFLQGLRQKAGRLGLPITITDIQPGFVDTPLIKAQGLPWVAPASKAAEQIFMAIKRKKKHAYITRRWLLAAWLIKLVPDCLYNRT